MREDNLCFAADEKHIPCLFWCSYIHGLHPSVRVGGIITDDCLLSYAAEIYLIQRRTSRMPCHSRALILSEALCRKVFGRLRQPRAADGEPASNVTSVIELYWALLEISSRETNGRAETRWRFDSKRSGHVFIVAWERCEILPDLQQWVH